MQEGSNRFEVDDQNLNVVTECNSYLTPRIEDCIDSIADAVIFWTLDVKSSNWQLAIEGTDRSKTVFTLHYGLYRLSRMPYKICSALGTFQQIKNIALSSGKCQLALVCVDDIMNLSRTADEQVQHACIVLSQLQRAGVKGIPDKRRTLTEKKDYLGPVIIWGRLKLALHSLHAKWDLNHLDRYRNWTHIQVYAMYT